MCRGNRFFSENKCECPDGEYESFEENCIEITPSENKFQKDIQVHNLRKLYKETKISQLCMKARIGGKRLAKVQIQME